MPADEVFLERGPVFFARQFVAGDDRDMRDGLGNRGALGVLREPAAQVARVADVERLFVVAAQQIDARLAVEAATA